MALVGYETNQGPLSKEWHINTRSTTMAQEGMGIPVNPDPAYLLKVATMRMPFGKYKGIRLVDLPERYIVWFSQKGFPKGSLGDMLRFVYEIKLNGLEFLFEKMKT